MVEHLFRWSNWDIVSHSDAFEKDDAQTIHFDIKIPPDGEKVVKYQVHYSW